MAKAKKVATAKKTAAPAKVPSVSLFPCSKPCFLSEYRVENSVGGQHNPFHWIFDMQGYPMVSVVLQFRGPANKHWQVQLRHHHPKSTVGPTATYVIDSKSGDLPPGGFALAEFSAVRPRLPELDIIAFSNTDQNFDTVVATVYATV